MREYAEYESEADENGGSLERLFLCLLFCILATSKVISGQILHTHGDFIMLPHWENRPLAP